MPQTYAFAPSRYTSICSFVKAWDAKEVGLCAAHGENHRSSFIGSECNHFELSSLVRFTRRGGGRPQLTSRIWAPPSPRREDGGARGEGGAYPPPPIPGALTPPPPPRPPAFPATGGENWRKRPESHVGARIPVSQTVRFGQFRMRPLVRSRSVLPMLFNIHLTVFTPY